MDLKSGETIFDKINISYDDLRQSENPIAAVKSYYKGKAEKNGNQMPWWISGSEDSEKAVGMNLRLWRDLKKSEKREMKVWIMTLFTEVISGNYNKATLWLASAKGIVCGNLRDLFSAGGQVPAIGGKNYGKPLPKIVESVYALSKDIKSVLSEGGADEFIKEYNPDLLNGVPLDVWFEQANENLGKKGVQVSAEELFNL